MRLPSILILSLVILASCLLFSVDFHGLRAFLQLQVPSFAQGAVAEAISFFKLTVVRFIRAYCIICLVTFFELEIGFLLIGVDYSMTLATIIALVDILPILGCGTVLNPGTVIGKNTNIYPLSSVRGVIEPDSIYKSSGETVKKRHEC